LTIVNRQSSIDPPLVPVLLAGFTAFLGFYATQPLLPLFGRVFAASTFAVSLTVTSPTIAVAIAAPVVGRIADARGRHDVIVVSAFGLGATMLLLASSSGLRQVVIWRFVQGLLMPGAFAVTLAYIHDQWPASRAGRATAAYVTGTVFGGFVGRALAGIVAFYAGWRASFIALGIVDMACAAGVWRWLPRDHTVAVRRDKVRSERARYGSPFQSLLRNRELLVTCVVGFCVLFSQVAMFTYVTFHLAAPPFELTSAELGWLFSVYLVGVAVTPLSGRWIDAQGPRLMLVVAMTIGVGGALLTLARPLAVVIGGLALCCTSVFIAQSTASTHLGVVATRDRGAAIGIYASCYYVGGTVGGAVPAVLWRLGGWPACVALIVAVQCATAATGLFFWNQQPFARRHEAYEGPEVF
jgi:MFS transporter, YNFM family, putative membrane transport protein